MHKFPLSGLLAASLMVTGCTAADLALINRPTSNVTAKGQLVLTPQFVTGGYAVAGRVQPLTRESVHHLVIRLFVLEGREETPALNAAGRPIEVDVVRAELGNPITLTSLRANTTYRVRAFAYRAAGTAEADLISRADEGSFVEVEVRDDDRPTMAHLKVTLTDVPFSGVTTSEGVTVIDGGYTTIAPERIVVGTNGILGSKISDTPVANTTGGYLEMVRIGNRVYLMGGLDDNTRVMGANVEPDGSLSEFESAGVNLTSPRRGYRTAIIGQYLYLFGGHNPDQNAFVNTIERAAIHPDGSLGDFETVATTLPSTLVSFGIHVGGGKVHIFGGGVMTGQQTQAAYTAPINPNGDIGNFVAAPQLNLPQVASAFATVRAKNRLYVLGSDQGARNSVLSAPILPDGSLGAFADTGVTLQTGRGALTAAFIGDRIYAIGGFSPSNPVNTVEMATVNPDGSLGEFSLDEELTVTSGEWGHESVIAGNSLYVFGGAAIQRFPILTR